MRQRPAGFRVLIGEDAHCFDALNAGADGAILLSAHIETEQFAAVLTHLAAGNHDAAAGCWRERLQPDNLLFTEPSPAPAKYWLSRIGLIDSDEVRSADG